MLMKNKKTSKLAALKCWLSRLVSRHEWGEWEDVKSQISDYGQYRVIQAKRCKKTGKLKLRTVYAD